MKIIKYLSITFLFGALILSTSCKEEGLEVTNPNELSPETFFQTEAQVQSAVNAAYGNLQTRGLYNRHIWFGYDNMAHENSGNPQLESDKRQYLNFTFDPTHGPIGAFWESCYRGIKKANLVINNAEKIAEIPDYTLSAARKAKFEGEAKFLRGLYYFMLVTRFGDVPLALGLPEETAGIERTPAAQVWAQIESDLTAAAAQCLPKDQEQKGRATKGAAYALLGKAYLFQGKYQDALTAFGNVTGYDLEANYFNNFMEETEHGVESIFEVEFNTAAGYDAQWNSDRTDAGLNEATFRGQEYGCFNWYNVFPSLNLRNEYETGDPRYGYCFYENGDTYNNGESVAVITPLDQSDGSTHPRAGWRKYEPYYKQASVEGNVTGINMKIIRYADVLLMMAECQAQLGNIPAGVALMNRVRARADVNMPPYPTADYPVGTLAQFMVALEHERKVELCGEQIRWPDLVRWGRAVPFITALLAGNELPLQEKNEMQFNENKLLWPIPQGEIDNNPKLTNANQNPGY